MKFKLNQRVAWVSQSNGTTKEKHGKVIRVVPAWEAIYTEEIKPQFFVLPSGGFGLPRNHESYLVEVHEGKRKPKLYWPVVARLEAD